jgi:protein arginine kinase
MVNEEDHVRLQALKPGLAPEETWEIVDWADDVLAEKLDYGYSGRYGYLAANVSNVGTGLRVSAMMHLAGLAFRRKLGGQLKAAYDLGVSVRGLFGEGAGSAGDLYQVSNEVTLGLSEKEVVEKVRSVAEYLIGEERQARKEVLCDERNRLIGRATRALETLQHSMAVRPRRAITLLSQVRLAAGLGLVENCSNALLNELLVGMQVGAGEEPGPNIGRAALLRDRLADTHIVSD